MFCRLSRIPHTSDKPCIYCSTDCPEFHAHVINPVFIMFDRLSWIPCTSTNPVFMSSRSGAQPTNNAIFRLTVFRRRSLLLWRLIRIRTWVLRSTANETFLNACKTKCHLDRTSHRNIDAHKQNGGRYSTNGWADDTDRMIIIVNSLTKCLTQWSLYIRPWSGPKLLQVVSCCLSSAKHILTIYNLIWRQLRQKLKDGHKQWSNGLPILQYRLSQQYQCHYWQSIGEYIWPPGPWFNIKMSSYQ